jgi:putative membrane protein
MTDTTRSAFPLDRAAWVFLAVHAGLSVFGAVAYATVLAGDTPQLLVGPYTAAVFQYSLAYAPMMTVYAGALAALLHTMPRMGAGRAFAMFVAASAVALASELGGTNVGLPFGPYHYTDMLGWKILGDVPPPIPVSWYYMLYGCLAICARLLAADDSNATKWKWAVAAGFLLTFWDIPQDPAMTAVQPVHWAWDYDQFPAWVPAFIKAPFFYGMPLSNWIGWVITGIIVARLMLALLPPTRVRDAVAPTRLPIVLYAVGGVMPLTICAKHGMWWAVIPGILLMYGPVLLALRGERRASAARPVTGEFRTVAMSGD